MYYRNQVLNNYYMAKEAALASLIVPTGASGLTGSLGKKRGRELAKEQYKGLTEADLDRIDEDSQGGGKGALRGLGYSTLGSALGLTGALLGGAKTLEGYQQAMTLGALGLGGYGTYASHKKAKKEYLKRARRMSDSKRLALLEARELQRSRRK